MIEGALHRLARLALLLLISVLCVAFLPGCSSLRVQMRKPGERNKTMPAKVLVEYHCDKRELPFFEIEENELLPEKARPGAKLNHRIIYVMCPERPTEVVAGTLETRILFKGKVIFEEAIDHELKPGRWVVDTFIPLPAKANPGVYALEVEFRSRRGNLAERSDFIVEPEKK